MGEVRAYGGALPGWNSGIGAGSKFGLASFHLMVGAVLILGLRRTTSRRTG